LPQGGSHGVRSDSDGPGALWSRRRSASLRAGWAGPGGRTGCPARAHACERDRWVVDAPHSGCDAGTGGWEDRAGGIGRASRGRARGRPSHRCRGTLRPARADRRPHAHPRPRGRSTRARVRRHDGTECEHVVLRGRGATRARAPGRAGGTRGARRGPLRHARPGRVDPLGSAAGRTGGRGQHARCAARAGARQPGSRRRRHQDARDRARRVAGTGPAQAGVHGGAVTRDRRGRGRPRHSRDVPRPRR